MRQLSFISEYTSDIVHVAGKDNVVADSFSRAASINASTAPPTSDLPAITKMQAKEARHNEEFKAFDIGIKDTLLFCVTTQPNPPPVVPMELRRTIFDSLYALCHPGIKATTRMISTKYFWRDIKKDAQAWCKEFLACQSSKVGTHIKRPLKDLPVPTKLFSNVHMDIVGPLEPEDGNNKPRYLLTVIYSWTRWFGSSADG